MDLNPDEAVVAAGWLRERGSLFGQLLHAPMLHDSLQQANRIVVLDRFMCPPGIADRASLAAGDRKLSPPGRADKEVIRRDESGRQRLRSPRLGRQVRGHVFGQPLPLPSLGYPAGGGRRRMFDQPQTVFCFVGGGKEFPESARVCPSAAVAKHSLLPYQPLKELPARSAADLHAVVRRRSVRGDRPSVQGIQHFRIGTPSWRLGRRRRT